MRRLLLAVLLVLGAVTLVFILLHAVPGDPAAIAVGDFATPAQIQAVRHELGLDRPLPVQYVTWIAGVAHGNFGESLSLSTPVSQLLLQRLPHTLELVLVSVVLGLCCGIPIGVVSALRRAGPVDIGLSALSLTTLSIPTYVSGTVVVLLFAVRLHWLPASGYVSFAQDPIGHIKLLILPCLTLAAPLVASVVRFTRSSVLEVISQDYVRTARGKGLQERQVLRRHVLRNSLLPITTIVGLQAGNLLGGAVIIEIIFAWPGLATLLFQGIGSHDYPLVQGCVLVISGLFILFNLIVDIVNGFIDPRMAYGAAR